ncbi:Beta-lactamase [Magnetococcus marinus MC-1]|uniref:Beta-lactamase n=1 Tax=Magnetococcus marinus (strain ATCC BAA-1437 / JCM 17883 / MC-1) TaxID=156889 RepID=A0L4Q7_MAGMM|nr:class D beta-lactamase [Magnetococcus marinus]ABK42950.1 Beta-lactamase [Magnetococcus marinus MC-1]
MFRWRFWQRCLFTLHLLLGGAVGAWANDAQLAELFTQQGVKGTLVIASLDGEKQFEHNSSRAAQRFVPASTFKIPHTLIALQEMAIYPQEVFIWDGQHRSYAAWNQNHTLATAFKVSCVWCYQELTNRISGLAYQDYLQKMAYGTAKLGPELSTFWLKGDLKISAREQVTFLRNLYHQGFTIAPPYYHLLKQMMQVEKTDRYSLYAKTGWGSGVIPQVGWYVGYVESPSGVWLFALNMEITNPDQLPLRQQLVMAGLRTKQIIVDHAAALP